MVSPVHGDYRRCQAETPLIDLFKFAEPALSSPVSASTFMYLMRWPVFRLIWLKLIFSESEVAGYKATGQVTSERRKKPFQLARGAMGYSEKRNRTWIQDDLGPIVPTPKLGFFRFSPKSLVAAFG
jgi:hypothetical protein